MKKILKKQKKKLYQLHEAGRFSLLTGKSTSRNLTMKRRKEEAE